MPAPATTDQLLTNLRKSGLLPPAQIESALANAPFGETPSGFLDRLVEGGLVTKYQAEKLSVGKYKGFVLGPYVILDRIGGGGMGHVFLAEHSAMRRKVALKVLSIGSSNDPIARERFFREARVAAGLDHPNVIRVFDLRREDLICYLVMEYIEGDNLQNIVHRAGPLPWLAAAHYAKQIATGLQHAHENGLVHRDIKPGNLLLAPDGSVKIIDLGLVRWDVEVDSKLTEKVDQSILGTADYLAPEQAVNSSTVDIRADIYSLGATLYFLLAGRPMFPEGKTAQKLMWQQLKQPAPIRDLAPGVPEALAAIVHKCLAKSPADRYATPRDLAEALAKLCEVPPPLPEPSWFPSPRSRSVSRASADPLPESRSSFQRAGLESTMFPPKSSKVAKSSHLFNAAAPSGRSLAPTLAEANAETPRRWSLPAKLPSAAPAVSRIYLPESELDRAMPPKAASPVVWVAVGIALALLAVGLVVLAKPF